MQSDAYVLVHSSRDSTSFSIHVKIPFSIFTARGFNDFCFFGCARKTMQFHFGANYRQTIEYALDRRGRLTMVAATHPGGACSRELKWKLNPMSCEQTNVSHRIGP